MMLLIMCIGGVAGYGYTEDVDAVIQKLRDINLDVRGKAAETLGEMKDARAAEPLIAALKDDDHTIQDNAVKALGKIGSPAAEPLIAALQDRNSSVRGKAVAALGEIGAPAVSPLIAALRNEDKNVQREAAWALALVGNSQAKDASIAF